MKILQKYKKSIIQYTLDLIFQFVENVVSKTICFSNLYKEGGLKGVVYFLDVYLENEFAYLDKINKRHFIIFQNSLF